jgi:carbamoyltransferase
MIALGVWDGHDSGAAVLADGRLVAAVNEERLTRRKLEVCFPARAIAECLALAGLDPAMVEVVAVSTTDFAKTLARVAPGTKESYYKVRRRQSPPGTGAVLRRILKYRLTEWPPTRLYSGVSRMCLSRALRPLGLGAARLLLVDHHRAHAAAAACGSGFDECVVVTIDGVGDGLCSSVSVLEQGVLRRVATTPAAHSPGVFFEHVTSLLNMRELEDEGKVMALADHAPGVADDENPLVPLLQARGLEFTTPRPARRLRSPLARILWRVPNEQFAAMAQRAVLLACERLVREAVRRTGKTRVALAGGVASNVKVNRAIRLLPEVDDVYVFPHMGDGGLAVGAALLAAATGDVLPRLELEELGLGPGYRDEEILGALQRAGLHADPSADFVAAAADVIANDGIVSWFQGRMEYGPRALGHRSVLARPDRLALKDRLNLTLKRRVYYQPFCPSILEGDARRLLADCGKGSPNRHMTMAYAATDEGRRQLAGVISADGTCRPHIVPEAGTSPFARLLHEVRRRTGVGAVLNTSFNIHGEPLVCTPEDAISVFLRSGADALVIGSRVVRR